MADRNAFMSEGVGAASIPQGSALTDMTKQTVLPEWYTNYAMDILSGQQAIASRPYETAPMPRVAGFTPTQQQAFGMTGTAATAYQPLLGQATQAAQAAAGAPGALTTAQPYYQQALSSLEQGIGTSGAAAAQPYFGQALSSLGQSAASNGVTAAQPYMTAAGQSSVANIGQYMNPYTEQVINRIGELGSRNLSENIMPQIEGRYIQAGQLGYGGRGGMGTPSGMMTDTSRAVRDINADILAQQTAALQQGYTQAAGLSAADLARQGQLASTAGNLAQGQQQALSTIGQQQANIGAQMGNLTAGQQSALLAAAGQQAGIGTQSGNLAQTQQEQQLAASGALSGLGAQAQSLGLTGAGALGGVGALEQQQGQKNLDVAYGDFLRQQGYPQEQINNMLNTFKGVATGVPSATQEYGISPSSVKQEYPASTASQIGGALTGAAGIIADLKKAGVI